MILLLRLGVSLYHETVQRAYVCLYPRFALASHFFWGLWAFIQSRISTIEFGYMVSYHGFWLFLFLYLLYFSDYQIS